MVQINLIMNIGNPCVRSANFMQMYEPRADCMFGLKKSQIPKHAESKLFKKSHDWGLGWLGLHAVGGKTR